MGWASGAVPSQLSGHSSRCLTIRISDVLPAPQGALMPIDSGGWVSGCCMPWAIALAYDEYPMLSEIVYLSLPIGCFS